MGSTEKSVLITGCSAEGIGSALAEEFHRHGWLVFATARDLAKVQHLKNLGCEIIELNVTIEETIKTAVKVVQKKTNGKLDMLINNAGMVYTAPVLDTDIKITKRLYDVNVFGLLSTTQHFAPLLLRAKGTIVNVGSIGAKMIGPFASQYQGTKAVVEMMSHAMRQELKPFGIHVIHMVTGLIATHCFDNRPTQSIPETSMYLHIKEKTEAAMKPDVTAMPPAEFARVVFARLISPNPPAVFWAGNMTWFPRIMNTLAFFFGARVWDSLNGWVSGLNDLTKIVRSKEMEMKNKVS